MHSDPTDPHPWGNFAFNGQEQRILLFHGLAKILDLSAVIETGAFRGSTTQFLQESTGLDVWSCELNETYYRGAKSKFAGNAKIHLHCKDSRVFLDGLAREPAIPKRDVFFYLDAHWDADLPLREEIQIIYRDFMSPIIMIDDFEVAHRSDFDFDDYGDGATLSIDILEPVLGRDVWLFYPDWTTAPGHLSNRGFVILAEGANADRIKRLAPPLRAFRPIDAALAQIRRHREMHRAAALPESQ